MTDQQRHREAVERYIADSQGRIAGQKLRIAELEAQGENSSILGKSLQRAEKSLAMMMAYREGLGREGAGALNGRAAFDDE